MQVPVMLSPGKLVVAGVRVNKRSPTATDHTVGLHIRALRRAAGLTLKDLGEAVGVSCVQLQRYETGASRIAASRLVAISEVLGVRVDSLIVEADPAGAEPMSRRNRNENAELSRVFKAISDPRHRLAIIALARAIAAREEQPGPGPPTGLASGVSSGMSSAMPNALVPDALLPEALIPDVLGDFVDIIPDTNK
jgi:transcriptional regulator with XRE-family HTH domain